MAVAGLRGTGDWGVDERPKDFRETILWLNANGDTPMQGLLSKMGSRGTTDPEFNWWEEKLYHVRLQLNQIGVGAGDTTLTVDAEVPGTAATLGMPTSGALSTRAGMILAVENTAGIFTGEFLKVTADSTVDTTLTVSRGYAGTTAAAIADDSYFTVVGTAFAEGTRSPTSTTKNPIKLFNYDQIFKTTYEVTETAKATFARTGDPVANDKRRKLFDIMRDMEMAMLWGVADETVGSNGKPERTTGGITSFITTNRTTFSSGGTLLTEDTLLDSLAPMFNWTADGRSTNERIAFIGNDGLNAINKLARNSASTRINFDKEITNVYGMKLRKWSLPQGDIYFKTHPLMNIHPYLTNAMITINPPYVTERPLRPLKFKDNVQENDADSEKGQWIAETGLEINFEETFSFLQGVSEDSFT